MTITNGTQTVLNSTSATVTVKTINDSSDSTTSPAHGLIDGNSGALVSPATSTLQSTANTSLATIATNSGNILAKGQATSANSSPVVFASDQSALPAFIPTFNTASAYAHTATTTAYAFGQLWANNATAGSVTFNTITVAKANNQAFNIIGGILRKSGATITNAIFRVHLYTSAPTTAVADRGTFAGSLTIANEIGYLDCTIDQSGSDISYGMCIPFNGAIGSIPVSGAQTLYWVIEVRGAYTPTSSESLTLSLVVQ